MCPHNSKHPYLLLSHAPSKRIKSKEFQVLLASFVQSGSVRDCGPAKPRFVPASSNNGVTKVAERYDIIRGVRTALRARLYMMCVKNAVRIAGSITADLALLAVARFYN